MENYQDNVWVRGPVRILANTDLLAPHDSVWDIINRDYTPIWKDIGPAAKGPTITFSNGNSHMSIDFYRDENIRAIEYMSEGLTQMATIWEESDLIKCFLTEVELIKYRFATVHSEPEQIYPVYFNIVRNMGIIREETQDNATI